MVIPGLKRSIGKAIESGFTLNDFKLLIRDSDIGISYDSTEVATAPNPVNIANYVDAVIRQEKTGQLVKAMVDSNPDNAAVKEMHALYNTYFTDYTGTALKPEVFHRLVIQNMGALFIWRKFFSEKICQMFNKKAHNRLVLNGIPKTGISYVDGYFGEVSSDINFKFIHINLQQIGKRLNPNDPVSDAEVAQVISARLKMDFPNEIKDFKLNTFLPKLETKLEELSAGGEKFLFFVDQFDYLHSPQVKIVLREMSEMLWRHPNMFLLVFDAYENWQQDWAQREKNLTESLDFHSFKQGEVEDYLKELYAFLKTKYTGPSEEFPLPEEYMTAAKQRLTDKHYDTTNGSNVPTISDELALWYADLKTVLGI